jgi:predicted nuclease with RNAse H fold
MSYFDIKKNVCMFVVNYKSINMKNKKIAPIMREMKIGESETYPASQKTAIESTRQRLQNQFSEKGIKFSVKKVEDNNVCVTRIS